MIKRTCAVMALLVSVAAGAGTDCDRHKQTIMDRLGNYLSHLNNEEYKLALSSVVDEQVEDKLASILSVTTTDAIRHNRKATLMLMLPSRKLLEYDLTDVDIIDGNNKRGHCIAVFANISKHLKRLELPLILEGNQWKISLGYNAIYQDHTSQ